MNIKSPCYNCANRHIGCHGQCKIYGEFRANLTAINERKLKEKESRYMADAVLSKATTRRMYLG